MAFEVDVTAVQPSCWSTIDVTHAAASLRCDEVHLWLVPLEVDGETERRYAQSLRDEERLRAARFHRGLDRRQFVVTRGALRRLLSVYVADAGSEGVSVVLGERGKPQLAQSSEIRFNVSHSGAHAIIGIAHSRDVGVDVERQRPVIDLDQIATSNFSEREYTQLLALPAHRRERAFFSLWTRKEAYAKAVGAGLSLPMDRVVMDVDPDRLPWPDRIDGAATPGGPWSMWAFEMDRAWCAVVCEGYGPTLRRFALEH